MTVEIVSRDVNKDFDSGFNGEAWLVKKGDEYFVVSGIVAWDWGGYEVLVFRSDEKANVSDWGEVAGGRNVTHEEAIEQLDKGELYDW